MKIPFLICIGFFAGLVDSVAGGGGLLSLPALLAAGIDPRMALGTNKVQSCLGTSLGVARYLKRGHAHLPTGLTAAFGALIGSYLGARRVLAVRPQDLVRFLPYLIAVVALLTFLRPRFGQDDRFPGLTWRSYLSAGIIGLGLGMYDGFFGPGTGTFLAFFFVLLLGFNFLRATANAKMANLASNIAAFAAFAGARQICWFYALPMAAANVAGNWVGAGLAMKRGTALIKPLFAAVLAGLLLKLIFFP